MTIGKKCQLTVHKGDKRDHVLLLSNTNELKSFEICVTWLRTCKGFEINDKINSNYVSYAIETCQ